MKLLKISAAKVCLAAAACLVSAASVNAQGPNADQQQVRRSMDLVLGINNMSMPPSGFPVEKAMSSVKLDPAVQASINEKLLKIMEQTIRETLSDARLMQEMRQRFSVPPTVPSPAATENTVTPKQ
jgi:hypothetical protein